MKAQFLYLLRLNPALHDEANWTDDHRATIERHFAYLQDKLKTGELILAGRTTTDNPTTFGIVIFEADDEAAARRFMEADPAVIAGVMTAELFPYRVALLRA